MSQKILRRTHLSLFDLFGDNEFDMSSLVLTVNSGDIISF